MNNQSILLINHFSALIEVENFDNESELSEALDNFTNLLNLNVVKKIDHTFQPIGKTLIYILSESHLAIHTWPEHKLIHLDLVSCSALEKNNVEAAINKSFFAFSITKLSLAQHEV